MHGRILLTGGGGMVGRNILAHPAAADCQILAPLSAELDLRDYRAVEAYLLAEKPDLVIHSAGRVGGIQANVAHPVDFLITNVDLGRNLLLAARRAGVKKLINLGSSCMYPRDAENPLREESILSGELEPTNEGYALAKIFAARLCRYINQEDSTFQYKTLIPCNLYGKFDKFAPEHSHLIPAVIRKIHLAKQAGLDAVDVWGDGTARREFMYAADLADAIMRAAEHFDAVPDLMNIGLGRDYSITEYYAAASEVIGWSGRLVYDTSKPVGMRQKLVSTTRQTAWGWAPSTSLLDGIAATYDFYLEECNS